MNFKSFFILESWEDIIKNQFYGFKPIEGNKKLGSLESLSSEDIKTATTELKKWGIGS